jgi:hypothetical protein
MRWRADQRAGTLSSMVFIEHTKNVKLSVAISPRPEEAVEVQLDLSHFSSPLHTISFRALTMAIIVFPSLIIIPQFRFSFLNITFISR